MAATITIADKIEEFNRKIALLDGDKKAYTESSQWRLKHNKERIAELRSENKLLRSRLSQRMKADDDVVTTVFNKHSLHTPAELRGISGSAALARFDQTVCKLIKHRNAVQHSISSRAQLLTNIEAKLKQLKSDEASISDAPSGESNLRQLENRLDKVIIKNNESKYIRKTYQAILEKLQEERLGFDNDISQIEKAIATRKKDLMEVESMWTDAQQARDLVKSELQHQEQIMASSRKERDKVLSEFRAKASERKEFQEKVERRLRRASIVHSASPSAMDSPKTNQDIQEAKISSYEEALDKIKDATGVSNIQEVVDRFLNQGNTKKHLEQLQEENTHQLARLKEDKGKLQTQFEDMKYSGEAKMSTGQRMLEEFEGHLNGAKKSCKESKEKADRTCKLLNLVKNGMEHLHDKLQRIKALGTRIPKPQRVPTDEEVLEQLSTVEQKLVALSEELASRDLDTIYKEMEDEEFRNMVEGGVANIRVDVSKADTTKPTLYDEDSGSDEECLSREIMKKKTAALVEAKTKKKPQDDDDDADPKRKRR